MRILVVTATKGETTWLKKKLDMENENQASFKGHTIDFLISGVGMTATAFALGKKLATEKYDLAFNLGVVGAFDRNLELGEVVEVQRDSFSELGAEDGDAFLSLEEIGLREEHEFPFQKGQLVAKHQLELPWKKVSGITVNTVHGNEESIRRVEQRTTAEVESMEGAAFFYACLLEGVPCLQLRAISNYVKKRNRNHWKIELALGNLAEAFMQLLNSIDE